MPERRLPFYSESAPRILENGDDFLNEEELSHRDDDSTIVVSQEEAEIEAKQVLNKIKEIPFHPDTNEQFDPKVEKKDEKLGKAGVAFRVLKEIARQHNGSRTSVGRQLLLVAKGPQELYLKTKAFFDLKVSQKKMEGALMDPARRTEALQIIDQMVNGIYGDENIPTYYRENADIAKKVLGIAFDTLSSNKELAAQEFDKESEKLLASILTGVVKYHYKGGLTNWKENPKIEEFFRSFSFFVQKQIETLKQNPEKYPKEIEDYSHILLPLICRGKEFDSQFEKLLLDVFLIGDNEEKKDDAIGSYKYRDVLLRLVDEIGISSGKFYNPDKNADYGEGENFCKNFRALLALERAAPGSAKRLWKEYGILTFARYPKELLLRQLEQSDDTDHPYGAIFYPREDWNGGFYSGKWDLKGLNISSQKAEVNVRVFECEGKTDFAKRLISLNRRYGVKQKIQFALVGGHGSPDVLEFGQVSRKQLRTKDLSSQALAELRSFFDKNATVILNSCSTGDDYGIGQTLSEIGGINVIAPDSSTGIKDLKVSRTGNVLELEVEYRDNVLRNYEKGKLLGRKKTVRQEISEPVL